MAKPTATTEAGGSKVLILGDSTATPNAKTPVSVVNASAGGDQAVYPSGWLGIATHQDGQALTSPGGFTTPGAPVILIAGKDGSNVGVPEVKTSAPSGSEKALIVRTISEVSMLTSLQLLDDTVATTASAIPTKGIAMSGTDGTNARVIKTDTSGELQVDVLTLPALAAGSNTIGNVKLTDGTDIADVLDLTNSNPLAVAIVDTSGNQIASFGGGVQYNELDSDASITGTVAMMEISGNQLMPLQGSTADGLLVNLGANNDVRLSDGTDIADILDLPNSNPLAVAIVDSNGDHIPSFGGGVQVVLDDPGSTTATGTIAVGLRRDTDTSPVSANGDYHPFIFDSLGNLKVNVKTQSGAGLSEYQEDTGHTDGNYGQFVLGVRRDADTTPVSADGDYHALLFDNTGYLKVNVKNSIAVASIAAGDNNIGNVDVLTLPAIPAGTNTIGSVKLTDGTDVADILDLTNSNPLAVAIVNASGDQMTSFATEYTSDAASPTDPVGGTVLAVRDDALSTQETADGDWTVLRTSDKGALWTKIDDTTPITVVISGSGNDVDANVTNTVNVQQQATDVGVGRIKIWDGTDVADVLDLTNSNPLVVAIVDGSGDQITSFGGGTQYTEDAAAASDPVGNMLIARRKDTLSATEVSADGDNIALNSTNKGQLHVKLADTVIVDGSAVTQPVSLASVPSHAVTNAGTFAVQVDGAALTSLQLIDDAIATTASAITSKGVAISGTDGTNARVIKTDTSGELQVDVLTLPALATGTNTIGSVKLTDGTDVADVFDLTNSNPLAVVLVDANGDQATLPSISQIGAVANATANSEYIVGVRRDADTVFTGVADGDASPLLFDARGALKVEVFSGGDSIPVTIPAAGVSAGAFPSSSFSSGAFAAGAIAAGASSFVKTEDAASADLDAGVPAMAVRKATPANTSGTDGDYEMLQMSAGRLWVSATIDAALPAGTNGIGKLTSNSGVTIGAVELASSQTLATLTTLTGGGVAHDGADSGNPVKVGARAALTLSDDTMVANADRTDLVSDADGALVIRNQVPLADVLFEALSNTDGASTASSVFGATASTRNYITSIHAFRTDAGTTPIYVDFRDGTGGSVLFRVVIPPSGGVVLPPGSMPYFKTTANTALAYDVSAATTTVYINLVGFKSKVVA